MLGISALGQLALAEFPQVKAIIGHIIGRLHHTAEELEERLKKQRANTFGWRWFKEFVEEQRELAAQAKAAKDKPTRKALKQTARAVEQVTGAQVDFEPLTQALQAARSAATFKETLASSKRAKAIVEQIIAEAQKAADDQDEEESIMLLLNG